MSKPKQPNAGEMTGAAKKVTARILTDLWITTDDSLDRFRRTRRPGDDTWTLDHLRQARDVLNVLGLALKTNDDQAWASLGAAWQRLQEPVATVPAEAAQAEPDDSEAESVPSKPAVADPAPDVPAPPPSTPGLSSSVTGRKFAPAASHGRRAAGAVPLGVPRPLRPLPKPGESNPVLGQPSRGQQAALPFTEPGATPATQPETPAEEELNWHEGGTAVGFSIDGVSPALPFRNSAPNRGADEPATDNPDENDGDGNPDQPTIAVLRTAPSDPSLLSQVISDADETMQLAPPSEPDPPASTSAPEARPSSPTATEPERDAATAEFDQLATSPGHVRPSLAHLHSVTLEQYAYLVAECEALPDRAEAAQQRIGVRDEYERSVLDEIFSGRFSQDPTTRSLWEQLRVSYRAWLEGGQSQ